MVSEDDGIEQIAEKVAERVINRLFLVLGINATDPKELIEFQKDFQHLRGWRVSMDLARRRGFATIVGFMITGALGYFLFLFTKH